jgi:hypothetical protein
MHARLPIALAGLFIILGCYTGPKPVTYSPRLYLHQNQPKQLWITLKDGSKVTMVGPRIIDDTLFGWTQGANEDLTVAISDIKSLQARRIDPIRTALIPIAFVGAGITVFSLVHHPQGAVDSAAEPCPDGECAAAGGE